MGMDKSQKVRQNSDTTAISSVSSCQQDIEFMAPVHQEDENLQVLALHSACILVQVNKRGRKEDAGMYLMQASLRDNAKHPGKREKCFFNLGTLDTQGSPSEALDHFVIRQKSVSICILLRSRSVLSAAR